MGCLFSRPLDAEGPTSRKRLHPSKNASCFIAIVKVNLLILLHFLSRLPLTVERAGRGKGASILLLMKNLEASGGKENLEASMR